MSGNDDLFNDAFGEDWENQYNHEPRTVRRTRRSVKKGAIDRGAFEAELQKSEVKERLFLLTHAEVGGQGAQAQQAFMETVINRATVLKWSINKIISDARYYQPYKDGAYKRAQKSVGDMERARYQRILDQVMAGSNVSNLATHNASGIVAEKVLNGGYDYRSGTAKEINGELFYQKTIEKHSRIKYHTEDIDEVYEETQQIDFISWLFKLLSIIFDGSTNEHDDWQNEEYSDAPASSDRSMPWMGAAKRYKGTREIEGSQSNSTIMRWARNLGLSSYKNDDTPWCGLFAAACMNDNDISTKGFNILGARQWLKFGYKVKPQYGAVMVFWRGSKSGWSGHVGFYVSEDNSYYHILGGNQSNMVNVTKISKNRFLGARWPNGFEPSGKVIRKRFDGKVTTNEE